MVVPFRGSGRRQQVSTEGGLAPRWRRDGRELFYFSPGGTLMAVPVGAGPDRGAAQPRALFALAGRQGNSWASGVTTSVFKYDVDARGERFLVGVAQAGPPPIVMAVGWQATRED